MIDRFLRKLIALLVNLRNGYLRRKLYAKHRRNLNSSGAKSHNTLYGSEEYLSCLRGWGEHTVWVEIQYLLSSCEGKILDAGCGTGDVMIALKTFKRCDVYGFDLSGMLVKKAAQSGVSTDRLMLGDATKMPFKNNVFDYAYSIGTLHQIPEDDIEAFLKESFRVTKRAAFFQVSASRSGHDEGWMLLDQRYHNNSGAWWRATCERVYPRVYVLHSHWENAISVGKWLVCVKE